MRRFWKIRSKIHSGDTVVRAAGIMCFSQTKVMHWEARGGRDYSRGGDQGGRNYSRGNDQGSRGGDQGGRDYSRGGDQGGRDYSRGGDQGGRDYSRGGDQGGRGYSRGNDQGSRGVDQGGRDYSRGGDQGGRGYSRGGDQGGRDYSRGGTSSNRSSYGGEDGTSQASSNRAIVDSQRKIAESMGEASEGARSHSTATSLSSTAAELHSFKMAFRKSRARKEKREIKDKALQALQSLRIDLSTQDERSISIILNCAVFFELRPNSFQVRDCVRWSSDNLPSMKAQNVALFAHAITTLGLRGAEEHLKKVEARLKTVGAEAFAPVELAMLMQSFTKASFGSPQSFQCIIEHLIIKAPQVLIREMSTVLQAVAHSRTILEDKSLVSRLVDAFVKVLEPQIASIHLNNILNIILPLARLHETKSIAADTWIALLQRAEHLAQFFQDVHIGSLIEFVTAFSSLKILAVEQEFRKFELVAKERIEAVAPFYTVESARYAALAASTTGFQLPLSFTSKIPDTLVQSMAWQRYSFSDIAACATAFSLAGVGNSNFYNTVVNIALGSRPRREGSDTAPVVPLDSDRQLEFVARHFTDVMAIRIAAERGLGAKALENASLSSTLPDLLEAALPNTRPAQLLKSLLLIHTAPSFPGRYVQFERTVEKAISKRLRDGGKEYLALTSFVYYSIFLENASAVPTLASHPVVGCIEAYVKAGPPTPSVQQSS